LSNCHKHDRVFRLRFEAFENLWVSGHVSTKPATVVAAADTVRAATEIRLERHKYNRPLVAATSEAKSTWTAHATTHAAMIDHFKLGFMLPAATAARCGARIATRFVRGLVKVIDGHVVMAFEAAAATALVRNIGLDRILADEQVRALPVPDGAATAAAQLSLHAASDAFEFSIENHRDITGVGTRRLSVVDRRARHDERDRR